MARDMTMPDPTPDPAVLSDARAEITRRIFTDVLGIFQAHQRSHIEFDAKQAIERGLDEFADMLATQPASDAAVPAGAWWTDAGAVKEARQVFQNGRKALLKEQGINTHLKGVYEPIIAALEPMLSTLAELDSRPPAAAAAKVASEGGAGLDRLANHVAEVMAEDGGCWTACSGCQESDEGYVSEKYYPYSPIFKCQPGGGCRECGGIGAIWNDGAFLASWGDALATDATDGATGGGKLCEYCGCKLAPTLGGLEHHASDCEVFPL